MVVPCAREGKEGETVDGEVEVFQVRWLVGWVASAERVRMQQLQSRHQVPRCPCVARPQCDQTLQVGALGVVITSVDAARGGPRTWTFCPDPLCLESKPTGSNLPPW